MEYLDKKYEKILFIHFEIYFFLIFFLNELTFLYLTQSDFKYIDFEKEYFLF